MGKLVTRDRLFCINYKLNFKKKSRSYLKFTYVLKVSVFIQSINNYLTIVYPQI